MHQVLQRTRPAAPPTTKAARPFFGLLRSIFNSRRSLGLLALIAGTALSSQVLHGFRVPSSGPPSTPAGADGREESGGSPEPAVQPAQSPPVTPRAAVAIPAGRPADAVATAGPGRASSEMSAIASAAPRLHRSLAPLPARPSMGWERPSRSRPGSVVRSDLRSASSTPAKPRHASAAARPAPAERSVRDTAPAPAADEQLSTIRLPALDASAGVPCSGTTAALPSDKPPEEAWLPGRDASSVLSAAVVEPNLSPPIDSESPDRAAGLSSHLLQATRNTPCLLKQPAGRN